MKRERRIYRQNVTLSLVTRASPAAPIASTMVVLEIRTRT